MKIGVCVVCEQEKAVNKSRLDGKLYCLSCKGQKNYHEKKGWVKCHSCGKFKDAAKVTPPTCYSCVDQIIGICEKCGQEKKRVYGYKDLNIRVCPGCRTQLRREDISLHEWCIYCPDVNGRRPVAVRDEDGLAVCHEHWRHHRSLHPNPKKA
ncbi:MAG: hypothetical protein EBV07_01235 [Proteobacteria bacterium]|nr:hypothetical protein [Pseudomonadota bacterium]